ncbi:MAG: hypothetical protein JJU06_14210 [Ectothiorhodospiraceae bacterium]|nr:hypothetical protein [Ectothiorhodospiraceae bacterium]
MIIRRRRPEHHAPPQRRTRGCTTVLALALALLASPVAAAYTADTRWQNFRAALQQGDRNHGFWRGGWTAFHTGGLGLALYQSVEGDRSADRFDGRVSAVKSALALGGLALSPSPYGPARQELVGLQQRGDRALPEAERMMHAMSHRERQQLSLRSQASSIGVNLAAGAIIAIGDGRPRDGAANAATGLLVTTVQTLTRPRTVSRAREAGRLDPRAAVAWSPVAWPRGGGMVVGVRW